MSRSTAGGDTMPLLNSPRSDNRSRTIAKINCKMIANQKTTTTIPVTESIRSRSRANDCDRRLDTPNGMPNRPSQQQRRRR